MFTDIFSRQRPHPPAPPPQQIQTSSLPTAAPSQVPSPPRPSRAANPKMRKQHLHRRSRRRGPGRGRGRRVYSLPMGRGLLISGRVGSVFSFRGERRRELLVEELVKRKRVLGTILGGERSSILSAFKRFLCLGDGFLTGWMGNEGV